MNANCEIDLPLFRKKDPATSKEAAERCGSVAAKHETAIVDALFFGSGCKDEIAELCGLNATQVARRMKGLIKKGLVIISDQCRITPAGRKARVYCLPSEKGVKRWQENGCR